MHSVLHFSVAIKILRAKGVSTQTNYLMRAKGVPTQTNYLTLQSVHWVPCTCMLFLMWMTLPSFEWSWCKGTQHTWCSQFITSFVHIPPGWECGLNPPPPTGIPEHWFGGGQNVAHCSLDTGPLFNRMWNSNTQHIVGICVSDACLGRFLVFFLSTLSTVFLRRCIVAKPLCQWQTLGFQWVCAPNGALCIFRVFQTDK